MTPIAAKGRKDNQRRQFGHVSTNYENSTKATSIPNSLTATMQLIITAGIANKAMDDTRQVAQFRLEFRHRIEHTCLLLQKVKFYRTN